MIWHFAEVWLMVLLTFVIGCLAGAHLYGFVGGTRLAPAQGAVADFVGDVLDRVKGWVGLAPSWRRAHLRQVERPVAAPVAAPVASRSPAVESDTVADMSTALVAAAPVAGEVSAYDGPHAPAPADSRPAIARTPRRTRAADTAPAALPAPVAVAPRPAIVPKRPPGLAGPRGGVPDNLQRIKGIGKRNERQLNDIGIYHFSQIAAWTPAEVVWIGTYLAFPDRIARDDWTGQATLLALGSGTGFQKSAERRRDRRRQEREFQERMASASAVYETPVVIDDFPSDLDVTADDGVGEVIEAELVLDDESAVEPAHEYADEGEYPDEPFDPSDEEIDAENDDRR